MEGKVEEEVGTLCFIASSNTLPHIKKKSMKYEEKRITHTILIWVSDWNIGNPVLYSTPKKTY